MTEFINKDMLLNIKTWNIVNSDCHDKEENPAPVDRIHHQRTLAAKNIDTNGREEERTRFHLNKLCSGNRLNTFKWTWGGGWTVHQFQI